jgi:hypothetical protein
LVLLQLGVPDLDVVDTLTEMFLDNSDLLDTHYASEAIQAAISSLRYSTGSPSSQTQAPQSASIVYTHDHRILNFLATLCACGNVPVPHNQNAIATAFFVAPYGPPLSTRATVAGVIEVRVPARGESGGEGEWMDIVSLAAHAKDGMKGLFSTELVPLHHAQCVSWLIAQLNLGGMVCMGQNYKSIHLVEGCHTWKEAFKALVQPSIPFDISN